MTNLVPVNIRIPEDDYKLYKHVAAQKGQSLAELVRVTMSSGVKKKAAKKKKPKYSIWDLPKYAVRSGTSDGSINHDKYIYDIGVLEKRKNKK